MELPEDEIKPGAPEWVVTFGDMMSLLLTFFVMLLSFSTMEASKFKIVAGYMREAFGLQYDANYVGIPMGTTILSTDAREHARVSDELDLLQKVREGKIGDEAVLVFLTDESGKYHIELTYNCDGRDYELGNQFGHLAFHVDDLEAVVKQVEEKGWWYRRSKPGNRSKYIFVKDPNGYDVEILQRK